VARAAYQSLDETPAFGFGFGVGVWRFGVGVRVEIGRLFSVALDLSRHGPGGGDRFGGSLSMEHGRAW